MSTKMSTLPSIQQGKPAGSSSSVDKPVTLASIIKQGKRPEPSERQKRGVKKQLSRVNIDERPATMISTTSAITEAGEAASITGSTSTAEIGSIHRSGPAVHPSRRLRSVASANSFPMYLLQSMGKNTPPQSIKERSKTMLDMSSQANKESEDMEVLERFLDYLKQPDESEDESVSGENRNKHSGIPDNKAQAKKKNPNKKQFPPPPSAGESDTDEDITDQNPKENQENLKQPPSDSETPSSKSPKKTSSKPNRSSVKKPKYSKTPDNDSSKESINTKSQTSSPSKETNSAETKPEENNQQIVNSESVKDNIPVEEKEDNDNDSNAEGEDNNKSADRPQDKPKKSIAMRLSEKRLAASYASPIAAKPDKTEVGKNIKESDTVKEGGMTEMKQGEGEEAAPKKDTGNKESKSTVQAKAKKGPFKKAATTPNPLSKGRSSRKVGPTTAKKQNTPEQNKSNKRGKPHDQPEPDNPEASDPIPNDRLEESTPEPSDEPSDIPENSNEKMSSEQEKAISSSQKSQSPEAGTMADTQDAHIEKVANAHDPKYHREKDDSLNQKGSEAPTADAEQNVNPTTSSPEDEMIQCSSSAQNDFDEVDGDGNMGDKQGSTEVTDSAVSEEGKVATSDTNCDTKVNKPQLKNNTNENLAAIKVKDENIQAINSQDTAELDKTHAGASQSEAAVKHPDNDHISNESTEKETSPNNSENITATNHSLSGASNADETEGESIQKQGNSTDLHGKSVKEGQESEKTESDNSNDSNDHDESKTQHDHHERDLEIDRKDSKDEETAIVSAHEDLNNTDAADDNVRTEPDSHPTTDSGQTATPQIGDADPTDTDQTNPANSKNVRTTDPQIEQNGKPDSDESSESDQTPNKEKDDEGRMSNNQNTETTPKKASPEHSDEEEESKTPEANSQPDHDGQGKVEGNSAADTEEHAEIAERKTGAGNKGKRQEKVDEQEEGVAEIESMKASQNQDTPKRSKQNNVKPSPYLVQQGLHSPRESNAHGKSQQEDGSLLGEKQSDQVLCKECKSRQNTPGGGKDEELGDSNAATDAGADEADSGRGTSMRGRESACSGGEEAEVETTPCVTKVEVTPSRRGARSTSSINKERQKWHYSLIDTPYMKLSLRDITSKASQMRQELLERSRKLHDAGRDPEPVYCPMCANYTTDYDHVIKATLRYNRVSNNNSNKSKKNRSRYFSVNVNQHPVF